MAREDGRIFFIVLIPLYFINVGIERISDNRYRFRTVRRTKVEKLQAISDGDFYDLMSSHARESDNVDYSGKLDKPGRNSGDGKKRRKKRFKRNKVAPAPQVEAWQKNRVRWTVACVKRFVILQKSWLRKKKTENWHWNVQLRSGTLKLERKFNWTKLILLILHRHLLVLILPPFWKSLLQSQMTTSTCVIQADHRVTCLVMKMMMFLVLVVSRLEKKNSWVWQTAKPG